MSLVIFWIGFVGIPIFLVLAFFDYRKKTGKMKRNLYLAAASFILFLIGMAITPQAQEATQTVSSEVSQKDVTKLDKEIKQKETELNNIESKIKENKKSYDAAMVVVNDKSTVEKQLNDLNSQIDVKKTEMKKVAGDIAKLDGEIKAKEKELASVTGAVKQKKEAPKSLSAGKFIVGTDIPAGRYKVKATSGSGNFFVNQGIDVNVILGGSFGIKEYITQLNDGDEIDINIPAKFTPVE